MFIYKKRESVNIVRRVSDTQTIHRIYQKKYQLLGFAWLLFLAPKVSILAFVCPSCNWRPWTRTLTSSSAKKKTKQLYYNSQSKDARAHAWCAAVETAKRKTAAQSTLPWLSLGRGTRLRSAHAHSRQNSRPTVHTGPSHFFRPSRQVWSNGWAFDDHYFLNALQKKSALLLPEPRCQTKLLPSNELRTSFLVACRMSTTSFAWKCQTTFLWVHTLSLCNEIVVSNKRLIIFSKKRH